MTHPLERQLKFFYGVRSAPMPYKLSSIILYPQRFFAFNLFFIIQTELGLGAVLSQVYKDINSVAKHECFATVLAIEKRFFLF